MNTRRPCFHSIALSGASLVPNDFCCRSATFGNIDSIRTAVVPNDHQTTKLANNLAKDNNSNLQNRMQNGAEVSGQVTREPGPSSDFRVSATAAAESCFQRILYLDQGTQLACSLLQNVYRKGVLVVCCGDINPATSFRRRTFGNGSAGLVTPACCPPATSQGNGSAYQPAS